MMNRSLSISYISTLNLDQHGNPHSKYADAVHPKEWRIVKVKEKDGKKYAKDQEKTLSIVESLGISAYHYICTPKDPQVSAHDLQARGTARLEA